MFLKIPQVDIVRYLLDFKFSWVVNRYMILFESVHRFSFWRSSNLFSNLDFQIYFPQKVEHMKSIRFWGPIQIYFDLKSTFLFKFRFKSRMSDSIWKISILKSKPTIIFKIIRSIYYYPGRYRKMIIKIYLLHSFLLQVFRSDDVPAANSKIGCNCWWKYNRIPEGSNRGTPNPKQSRTS